MEVESSLNLIRPFAQLPFDFSFVLKNVGSCRNRLNSSPNLCLTFARHSFDAVQTNVGQKSIPFTRASCGDVVSSGVQPLTDACQKLGNRGGVYGYRDSGQYMFEEKLILSPLTSMLDIPYRFIFAVCRTSSVGYSSLHNKRLSVG